MLDISFRVYQAGICVEDKWEIPMTIDLMEFIETLHKEYGTRCIIEIKIWGTK